MKPLKVYDRPERKQVEIVMMMSMSVDADLLRTNPVAVKKYVRSQLMQDAEHHIDETDFSAVIHLGRESDNELQAYRADRG